LFLSEPKSPYGLILRTSIFFISVPSMTLITIKKTLPQFQAKALVFFHQSVKLWPPTQAKDALPVIM